MGALNNGHAPEADSLTAWTKLRKDLGLLVGGNGRGLVCVPINYYYGGR